MANKDELVRLSALTQGMVQNLKEHFPGKDVRIQIKVDGEENYWLDESCYTIARYFYKADDT